MQVVEVNPAQALSGMGLFCRSGHQSKTDAVIGFFDLPHQALQVLPNDPFDYSFADEDYNKTFIAIPIAYSALDDWLQT